MAFKDTGRWQEQLCDTSNHRISGGSSSGLILFVWILVTPNDVIKMAANHIKLVSFMNQSISTERNTSYLLWITQRLQKNAFC